MTRIIYPSRGFATSSRPSLQLTTTLRLGNGRATTSNGIARSGGEGGRGGEGGSGGVGRPEGKRCCCWAEL